MGGCHSAIFLFLGVEGVMVSLYTILFLCLSAQENPPGLDSYDIGVIVREEQGVEPSSLNANPVLLLSSCVASREPLCDKKFLFSGIDKN